MVKIGPSHLRTIVFTMYTPVDVKDAVCWWIEVQAIVAHDDNLHVSDRAKRYVFNEGLGWYYLTATGPGGAGLLEDALLSLWCRLGRHLVAVHMCAGAASVKVNYAK